MSSFISGISVAKQVDLRFRSALVLSKLFTKSWGHPNTLKQMAKYRREVMSKRLVVNHVNELSPPIKCMKEFRKNDTTFIDAHFTSPHALLFPDSMPGPVGHAHFRAFLPARPGPICIHLAGTGDHSYFRREWLLVEDLLKQGIGSIIIQNPFYGDRKPPQQFRSSLENVSDLFVMGAAIIAETNYLIQWASGLGHGPFAISGVSMGGFMAQLAATNAHEPTAIVPILSWTTSSPSYTDGAIAPAIQWQVLQSQLDDASYIDKIKQIPEVTWLDELDAMNRQNGQLPARNMMRILMDYFTSLENYPTIIDSKLAHIFLADQDMYVLRDRGPSYEQMWPGCCVETMPNVGHVTAYFTKHQVWRNKIAELLKRPF